jgi:competence protein ComEC
MNSSIWLILCVAFIVGGYAQGWVGWLIIAVSSILSAIVIPLLVRDSPKRWVWLVAGLLALTACFYQQWRFPVEQSNDVARFAPQAKVTIRGAIADTVTTTRSGRARFVFEVEQLKTTKEELVSGVLYVTIPLTQATGLRTGQKLELIGNLYRPTEAQNPGGFDFQQFLKRQGIFAGFTARQVKLIGDPPQFGGWWFRRRMVQAHVLGVGVPEGTLLSSLVLGNRAVDLPNDIKDTFIRVGLAAALAASGFQVSLILGAILLICRSLSPWQQFGIGTACLWIFLLLTGVSPSVLRAVVMGTGTLIGSLVGRKNRPILGLAIAAVILLIYQPIWIYDLGFQFSFLATLGLLVGATPVEQRLTFMPPLFGAALAIPIAAYTWTLPLQLFVFGKVSPYSILANVLTTPLVSLGTIGGVISGFLGVIFVPLGALVSWLLLFSLVLMIAIARWIESLPGATSSIGTIALWQLIIGYGILIGLATIPWLQRQKRWIPAIFLMAIILFIPGIFFRANLIRFTVLATEDTPILLIQNQGVTTLINSGKKQTAESAILPFFQKEGINQVDYAIATDNQVGDGWQRISGNGLVIKKLFFTPTTKLLSLNKQLEDKGTSIGVLTLGQEISPNPNLKIELLSTTPTVISFTTSETKWLFLGNADLKSQKQLLSQVKLLPKLSAQVLWWNGFELAPELLNAIKPEVVIASTTILPEPLVEQIQDANIRLLWTGRDGAIEWTPTNKVQTVREAEDTASPLGF